MTRKVAVLVGSFRKESINQKFARVLEKLAEGKLAFDHVRIDDLPHYDDDLWADAPASVLRFKQQIADADAVLVITPEYNRSYPGVLKNAFDWGSRPYGKGVWGGKPSAVAGTSPGVIGAAVAQAHARLALTNLNTLVMHLPEVYLQWKAENFGDDDSVNDEGTRKFLQGFVDSFAAFIEKTA